MLNHNRSNRVLILSFVLFIVLGLPTGMLGVAWPAMQTTLKVSMDQVGILLLAGTISYTLFSFLNGIFMARFGAGKTLLAAVAVSALGMAGMGQASGWWMLVGMEFVASIGMGTLDAALNLYFAKHFKAGLMNWLHGCFGIGATLGPLLMTALFQADLPWRSGYLVVALCFAVLVLLMGVTLPLWDKGSQPDSPAAVQASEKRAKVLDTLKLGLVWANLGIFFVYCGVEVTTGQWAYSLLTQARNVPEATAGFWVSVYWGTFTFGRLFLGIIVDRLGTVRMLRWAAIGAVAGAILFAVKFNNLIGLTGLAIIGFALAPIFPTLISYTPTLIGLEHANNAVGFQVGLASFGYAVLPGIAGVLAANNAMGLEIIGPYLIIEAVIMLVLISIVLAATNKQPAQEKALPV